MGRAGTQRSPAYFNEQTRQRKNLLNDLLELNLSGIDHSDAQQELASLMDELKFDTDRTQQHLQRLCDDLEPGGRDLYTHYRMLCNFSHATAAVTDLYLAPIDQSPGIAQRGESTTLNPVSAAGMGASALVWAGMAVDYTDKDHTRRSELRRAGKVIGVHPVLRPANSRNSRKPKQT